MKGAKKIFAYVLAFLLVVSSFQAVGSRRVMASGTYVIKVDGTDNYLYAEDGKVAVGSLDENDKAFYWFVADKGSGYYWIQNRDTAQYMCLQNQSGTTGSVDIMSENYEAWDSSKWMLKLDSSTTIKNKWKSSYISVSGSEAVFGKSTTQKFSFISKSPAASGDTRYEYTGGAADWIVIPEPDSDMNNIGATMPYTRYDSEQATLGGGAVLAESKNFSKDNIASQASEQSYVKLPQAGAYAEWTMKTTGNGVTMRFTMPDSEDGMGQEGSVDVYVNDEKVQTVNLTSYYMWQYFSGRTLYDEPRDGATGCFAFDETHFKLDTSLKVGDRIRIQSTGENELEYGVDFLEIEETGEAIPKPENAYDVTDFGAISDDDKNDATAINKCIAQAQKDGKDVYIPEGTFHFGSKWTLKASNIKITGAGIWYTNIQFTNARRGGGGIAGSNADNVEFCNMYINSNLRSRYKEDAVYKCFMNVWSGGSYIHDIWEEHFECGFWIADYDSPIEYSDGLKIVNNRIRNNLADGVNFCQGTSHAVVYNCNIRNNGDDGLAMWNTNGDVKDEYGNVFCYNTIDFIWRAGAIAIYGGNGHKVYNNYIVDTFMASGVHLNTVFDGYRFLNNDEGIVFSNNIFVRSGTYADSNKTDLAAVDIMDGVRNVTFDNTYIYDAQHDAVRITGNPSDIVFKNLNVYGTGLDEQTTAKTNTGSLFKFADENTTQPITVDGLNYANIAYSNIFFGSKSGCKITGESNKGSNYEVNIPSIKEAGVIEPERYEELPVNPPAEIKVSGITIREANPQVEVNKKITLTVTVKPDDAINKAVTWSSDNTSVATVDSKTGEITGVKAGTAVITATATDGSGVKGTCTVTVKNPVPSTQVPPSNLTAPTTQTPSSNLAATTESPTIPVADTAEVTVKKTTVKNASKKKTAKSAQISLKKISGASGYEVKVSTSGKFKKSKTVTKKFSKATFTFTSSKIKNKGTLYVKARAYKKVNGKTYYGSWSGKKKVKMK